MRLAHISRVFRSEHGMLYSSSRVFIIFPTLRYPALPSLPCDRCHKKGIAGKLDLAMQWAVEQEEAGGEVNFKEGLAFYSSIGILQVRRARSYL